MDQNSSIDEPLLLGGGDHVKKKSLFLLSVKWILQIIIWIIFIAWVAIIMSFYPAQFGDSFFEKLVNATSETVLGPSGGTFMLLSGPVLLIASLSIPYLILIGDKNELLKKKSTIKPRMRLCTFPLIVGGPFGVICSGEFIGIVLFCCYVMWAICTNARGNPTVSGLEMVALGIGQAGMFCLAFLFLPVARGSLLLQLIDVPFEHAIRYHIWLGHLIILLFTLHGLCYLIAWTLQGTLHYQILEWKDVGIASFVGVIALITGFVIWVTSVGFVRKWKFEVFFYTHQLYVVFIVLLALHVSDYNLSMAAAGIFLFMLDRFLRFFQSRKIVDVVSARCLPCGTVELLLSKPKNLRYNALNFIFVQIREISWLQWHPFSISSSPLDNKNHLSILIKNLGNWTEKVSQSVDTEGEGQQYSNPTACVEGPYGHQIAYYLMYENLILIAGGIGISPFLAILSDILHRINGERSSSSSPSSSSSSSSSSYLPNNILIIWAVKTSKEIHLLSTINMDSISPHAFLNFNLHIRIYVSRETNPQLEEGIFTKSYIYKKSSDSKGNGISVLVGTSDNIWYGVYVILSTMGIIIFSGLVYVFYINPYQIFKLTSYKGLLFLACLVVALFIFGGLGVGLWLLWERNISSNANNEQVECNEEVADKRNISCNENNEQVVCNVEVADKNLFKFTMIEYGSRPDFKEIFELVSKKWGHVDVGVIVCGPSALESSVATQIRSHYLRRESNHPIFHFHTHSFDF